MPGPAPKQLSAEQFQDLVSDYPGFENILTYINDQTRKTSTSLGEAVTLGETLAVVPVNFTTPATGGEGRSVARYTTAATGSYPNGDNTILNFATRVIDSDNAVTVGTTWRYTAKYPGDHLVSAGITIASYTMAAGHQHELRLYKNGQIYTTMAQVFAQATATTLTGLYGPSVIVNMAAGDYLHTSYFNATTGVDRNLSTDANSNHIDIVRLHDPTPDTVNVGVKKAVSGKVQAVLVGKAERPKSTERVPNPRITWEMDGDNIRIRTVQGLQAATAYRLTLIVIGGG